MAVVVIRVLEAVEGRGSSSTAAATADGGRGGAGGGRGARAAGWEEADMGYEVGGVRVCIFIWVADNFIIFPSQCALHVYIFRVSLDAWPSVDCL